MTTISHIQRVIFFPIKDIKATRNLVSHLVTSPNDSIILPYIDHPGPLSTEILSKNFRSLTVCEPDPDTRNKFQALITAEYRNKNIHVFRDDLFDLSYKTHSDEAQKRCAELVKHGLDVTNPEIGSDRNVKLLVPLLKNRQLAYMTAKTGDNMRLYRSASVLYNTLFRMETLASYDLERCFGISVKKLQKTAVANNASYSKVHLVLLRPNLDLVNSLNSRSLIEFRFLVTQMMHKRRRLVFAYLDRFFSDYKRDLTHIGINHTTRCGDLTKEQYYELFVYLVKRPDYRSSTFLQAVASGEENILSIQE